MFKYTTHKKKNLLLSPTTHLNNYGPFHKVNREELITTEKKKCVLYNLILTVTGCVVKKVLKHFQNMEATKYIASVVQQK